MAKKAKAKKSKGTLFGKPRNQVIKHPGIEKKAAKKAGMTTQAFMERHKNDPSVSGQRARLGIELSKMAKKRRHI
jgi:hypothetical protein